MNKEEKFEPGRGGSYIEGGQVNVAGDVVGGNKYVYQSPTPAIAALHQLPPSPRDFTGRTQELTELMEHVEKGGTTIFALLGLGGVGKTTLALKFAEQLNPRYPDAQLYLDLKGTSTNPVRPLDAMAHVIRAYHPDVQLPKKEAELSGLYQSVLHNQRAVLLMDNAKDSRQLESLVPPQSCALLITSRQHFTLAGLFSKTVGSLSPTDARTMLMAISQRIGDQADSIAKLCGYLPLALRLAGSAIAERIDLSSVDYARRLADTQQRLLVFDASLTVSLSLSYDLLSSDLQKYWRYLSIFPDTFDASAAAVLFRLNWNQSKDVLGQLVAYSMLEWNEATARYHLHDVARLFAGQHIGAEQDEVSYRHAKYFLGVIWEALEYWEAADYRYKSEIFDREWNNILAGQSWAAAHLTQYDEAAQLCIDYIEEARYYFAIRLTPGERIGWLEAALAAARRLKNRTAEAAQLGTMGNFYGHLDGVATIVEFYPQHALAICETKVHRGPQTMVRDVQKSYAHLSEAQRAFEFYQQALDIAREIGDLHNEGAVIFNVSLLVDRLGDRSRAIDLARASRQIFAAIPDHGIRENDTLRVDARLHDWSVSQ
jgi:NB-ARC domain